MIQKFINLQYRKISEISALLIVSFPESRDDFYFYLEPSEIVSVLLHVV